jgi:fibronectin type 3 domain-containing protein
VVTQEFTGTARDEFPPSPPGGLTAVAGIGTIELAWDRSPEPDVAGYRVFRSTSDAPPESVGQLTRAAAFSDRDVKAGVVYRYSVSAVDEKGNTSAPSAPVTVQAQ